MSDQQFSPQQAGDPQLELQGIFGKLLGGAVGGMIGKHFGGGTGRTIGSTIGGIAGSFAPFEAGPGGQAGGQAGGRGAGRDWRLALAAEWRDGAVVPSYAVLNPAGERQGVSEGQPIAMQAWAEASPATLRLAAADAAPGVASLLSRIEAARRQSDPNSLVNRPARIAFTGVTGAPGDGNASLPAQMRTRLAGLGMVVQDTAKDADFSLVGEVRLAPGAKGAQRVEIQWIVEDATGTERGRILQLNEVPPGTLDRHWGDVAVVVAEEAAGGVRDVVTAHGRRAEK